MADHLETHDPFEDCPIAEIDRDDEFGFRGCFGFCLLVCLLCWLIAGFAVWALA